ncbi:uncharacterized protein V1510DRAFT_368169 [Dipodascopsis tothii]|uniref:uncharacterized protein n=1 Tax=Dipodascopsis tothii TaxID=44089 RepID=UPI0034CE58DD
MESSPTLQQLPVEIITEVCQYLTVRDIHSLELSCKDMRSILSENEIWQAKIIWEYFQQGYELGRKLREKNEEVTWREIYIAMAQQWKFYCSDIDNWGVIWRNPHHWHLEEFPETETGKALVLRGIVWWLHIFRSVKVAPGKYRLVWGGILGKDSFSSTIEYNVLLADEDDCDQKGRPSRTKLASTMIPTSNAIYSQEYGVSEFGEVQMCDFEVPIKHKTSEEWQTILLEVREHGHTPKRNIIYDYVRLERLDGHMPFSEIKAFPYSSKHGYTYTDAPKWSLKRVIAELRSIINEFEGNDGFVY